MSDWIKRKREEKARKEEEQSAASQQEQLIGTYKYRVFEALQSIVNERIQEYNQSLIEEGKIRPGSKSLS